MMKMQVTCLLVAIITMVLLPSSQAAVQVNSVFSDERADNYPPCDIYLAPSKIGGWGVFAARDFEQYEVIEIAPRYLPLKNDWLINNVLKDYIYGHTDEDPSFACVLFGMTMFFNHGPGIKHNVLYTGFGQVPDKSVPWASMVTAFTARRKIRRGEELLSSYGEKDWFKERGLAMVQTDDEAGMLLSLEDIEQREHKYCSKAISGVGHPTWVQRVLPTCDLYNLEEAVIQLHGMLPLQDHPTAIAKEAVQAHQIIEIAPALVVPSKEMELSPLAPMTIFWLDLDDEQRETIKRLREHGVFCLKGVSSESGNMEPDVLEYFKDAAILPAAGNIGLVRKVGHDEKADSNCRIEIVAAADPMEKVNVACSGVVLKLIATKDIEPGEELRLNLPDKSSWQSKINLAQHLALTGQAIAKHLVGTKDPTMSGGNTDDEVKQEL
jgi:hypothetical protein